jgi:hypothetical protein
MGFIEPKRIQVKLLKPDLAISPHLVVGHFSEFQAESGGNSTMNLQKLTTAGRS